MCAWMPWGLAVVAMDVENCGYFAGVSLHRSLQEFAGVGYVPDRLDSYRPTLRLAIISISLR
jgi:hypothetical protein